MTIFFRNVIEISQKGVQEYNRFQRSLLTEQLHFFTSWKNMNIFHDQYRTGMWSVTIFALKDLHQLHENDPQNNV